MLFFQRCRRRRKRFIISPVNQPTPINFHIEETINPTFLSSLLKEESAGNTPNFHPDLGVYDVVGGEEVFVNSSDGLPGDGSLIGWSHTPLEEDRSLVLLKISTHRDLEIFRLPTLLEGIFPQGCERRVASVTDLRSFRRSRDETHSPGSLFNRRSSALMMGSSSNEYWNDMARNLGSEYDETESMQTDLEGVTDGFWDFSNSI
jgi:hypothetical protein